MNSGMFVCCAQTLQKTCKKQRDERDSALEAEHRALTRAAAIEADRDKIQRQFKVGLLFYVLVL